MPPKTEAQKKAQKRYMKSIATIQIRTTEDRRDTIKTHAESQGESVNGFINRAIDEAMERDQQEKPPPPAAKEKHERKTNA